MVFPDVLFLARYDSYGSTTYFCRSSGTGFLSGIVGRGGPIQHGGSEITNRRLSNIALVVGFSIQAVSIVLFSGF